MKVTSRYCAIMLLLVGINFPTAAQDHSRVKAIYTGFVFDRPPFETCHASTIVSLGKDKLIAAWFGGKYEGNEDVVIWASVGAGNKWSAPVVIADGVQPDGSRFPCWNPVLFCSKSNMLFLFYKVGPNPRQWWGEMKTSIDNGKTWSASTRLPDGFLGPIKNKPIQLGNGDILCASSTESDDNKIWNIHVERLDALGKKWEKTAIDCDSFGVIQPSILQYTDGRLQMLCRSRQNAMVETWSADEGRTWSPLKKLSLPNPNAGSDAVTLRNGMQMLIYNPQPAGKEWWEGRAVLKVAMSADGKLWKDVYTLEQQPKGEFSYPAVIQDAWGKVHITYTYDRKNIRYVCLSVD